MQKNQDFHLVGVLRIQSNPFVLIHTQDLHRWNGVDTLDRASHSAVLLTDERIESEIKLHQIPDFNHEVIELDYLGICLLYSSHGSMALMFYEPMHYTNDTSLIPYEFVRFSILSRKKVGDYNSWVIMDSLIDQESLTGIKLQKGIYEIDGIEGLDLAHYDRSFNTISYAGGMELKGIILH